MALQPISVLKNWFKTGAKPLQQQFWDWMDSFWHKSEAIPSDSVSGLNDLFIRVDDLETAATGKVVLTGSTTSITYQIPAGKLLEKAVVKSTATMTFTVSTASGGSGDIPIGQTLAAGQYALGNIDIFAEAAQNIYFEGLSGSVTITLYIR